MEVESKKDCRAGGKVWYKETLISVLLGVAFVWYRMCAPTPISEASQIRKKADSQSTIGCFVLIFVMVVERHSNHSAKIDGN